MYENDEIEIDLSRVFEIIKKYFKPFALIILAASIVAALITLFLIPKKYTAEAKLIICLLYTSFFFSEKIKGREENVRERRN